MSRKVHGLIYLSLYNDNNYDYTYLSQDRLISNETESSHWFGW